MARIFGFMFHLFFVFFVLFFSVRKACLLFLLLISYISLIVGGSSGLSTSVYFTFLRNLRWPKCEGGLFVVFAFNYIYSMDTLRYSWFINECVFITFWGSGGVILPILYQRSSVQS